MSPPAHRGALREDRPLSFLAGSYELGKTSFSRARGKERKVGQKYSKGAMRAINGALSSRQPRLQNQRRFVRETWMEREAPMLSRTPYPHSGGKTRVPQERTRAVPLAKRLSQNLQVRLVPALQSRASANCGPAPMSIKWG